MPRIVKGLLGSLLIIVLASFAHAIAQSPDEMTLRALIQQYYRLYAQKNANEIWRLWSAQSPDYKTIKAGLEKELAVVSMTVAKVEVNSLVIEEERATGRIKIELSLIESAGQSAQTRTQIQNVTFVRENGQWKILKNESAFRQLARTLMETPEAQEREKILAKNSELATPSLMEALDDLTREYRTQSNFAAALKIIEFARPLAEKIQDQKSLVGTYLSQGDIEFRRGQIDQAEASFRQALSLSEKYFLSKSIRANALLSLGNIGLQKGNYEQALSFYQNSLNLCQELKNNKCEAALLHNFGEVYSKQGNPKMALLAYYRSLSIKEAPGYDGPRQGIVRTVWALGSTEFFMGNYEPAIAYLKRALALAEQIGDKFNKAFILDSLSLVYSRLGFADQALAFGLEGLKLRTEIGNPFLIASTLQNLGSIQINNHKNLAEARDYFQQSLQLMEKNRDSGGISYSLSKLSLIDYERGHFEEALELAQKATAAKPDDWMALYHLGRASRALNDLPRAQICLQKSIALIEDLRRQVGLVDESRELMMEAALQPYAEMIDLQVSQKKIAEAFAIAERVKARVLIETMRENKIEIQRSLTAQEREEDERLRLRFVTANRQMTREAQSPHPDSRRFDELNARQEQARMAYEEFQSRQYAAHPELKIQRGELPPISVEETRNLLTEKNALMEFVVWGERTQLFIVTLQRGKPELRVISLPIKLPELAAKIDLLRTYIGSKDLRYGEPAKALYEILFKPVAPLLKDKTQLIIVPGGVLWEVPFQALMDADNRFLLEEKSIALAPSLTFLREMERLHRKRSLPGSETTLLAVGNPALSHEALARHSALMGEKLTPLPFAEQQVLQLGQVYKNQSKVLTGAAATEEAVKSEMSKYRIVHLATHGILNDRNPMYSHLVLAQTDLNHNEDGLLEARELMTMDLNAELAILSACETGRGRIRSGEGLIGLTWALFVAGVPSTIVSHWKVADKSTAEMMVAFHRIYQTRNVKGEPVYTKAEALRRAELYLLRQPKYKHPFYWAAFSLVGAGR